MGNEVKKIGLRHGTSIFIGTMLVQQGLDMVKQGEYMLGGLMIAVGGLLIVINFMSGLFETHVVSVKKAVELVRV